MLITCGTTDPIIAGDRYEGVTSAYAVLFFGANEQVLNFAVIPVINDPNESQETRDAAAKYLVDDQGKAIARQIHDERKGRWPNPVSEPFAATGIHIAPNTPVSAPGGTSSARFFTMVLYGFAECPSMD